MPKKKESYDPDRAIVISRETDDAIKVLAKMLKISKSEALDKILGVGIEAVRIGYFVASNHDQWDA